MRARTGSAWTPRRWILPPPGSSADSGPGPTDPSAYVGLFAGVFDVTASGEQEIEGVPTTHYVGTIDLKKVLEGFSDVVGKDADAATKEQLKAAVEQFESLGIDEKIPFEIWIDAEGLPRRQRITMDFGKLVPGAEDANMEMTIDFSDFGKPVRHHDPGPVRGHRHDRSTRGRRLRLRRLRIGAPAGPGSPGGRSRSGVPSPDRSIRKVSIPRTAAPSQYGGWSSTKMDRSGATSPSRRRASR